MLNQLRLLRDVSALILIACTWRLWFAASDFPAVPFFEFLVPVPRAVDSMLSVVLAAALLVDACLAGSQRLHGNATRRFIRIKQGCDLLFVTMAAGLILLNQHCLQPWMYHFLILTPLVWLQSSKSELSVEEAGRDKMLESAKDQTFSRTTILWLTSSIYVWSAWSKLDASFLQSHGPKFVGGICDAIGLSTRFWSDQTWRFTASMLPVGELIVGAALLFRRTRRLALAASLVMHLLLLLAVGPRGLDHRIGVLLWNAFFISQNLLLWHSERQVTIEVSPLCRGRAGWLRQRPLPGLVLIFSVAFPVLRSAGWCDTWPAWAVYASSPARVLMQVRDDSVDQLPGSVKQFVQPRAISDGWSWLRIDFWSLAATGAPIYPEDRFQLAIARSIARELSTSDTVRVIHEQEADRWAGTRERHESTGGAELAELASRFSLNSLPRK